MSLNREKIEQSIYLNKTLDGRKGCLVHRDSSTVLVVVGDLHGETASLDLIFSFVQGDPLWIFLGDYVDRGPDSLGILEQIIDFQVENPQRVILLRGNHEDWQMNLRYGFAREIYSKKKDGFMPVIFEWYESLPLVATTGNIALLHGGPPFPVPSDIKTLEMISSDSQKGQNILWSDPDDDFYFYRGGGTRSFTREDLENFLNLAGCCYMIRGHQYNPEKGFKINFESCLTIFSASYGYSWKRSFFYQPEVKEVTDLVSDVVVF